MKDIAALPVFAAVVAEGGFNKAAQQLGLTSSAVSKRITSLENQLGVRLLNRTTRSIHLTEAGELYYRHAIDALVSAEAAEQTAMAYQNSPVGTLRVNAPWSFGRSCLAKIVPLFLKQYPDITLDLNLSDTFANPISEGVDLALHPGELQDSNLFARKVARLHSVLCAAPEYLEQYGRPETPAELVTHNCLHSTHASKRAEWVLIDKGEKQKIKVEGRYRVNSGEGLLEAVKQGVGIGRLPLYIAAEELRHKRIEPVLPHVALPYKDLWALYPHRSFLPPKVSVFLEFLTRHLKKAESEW